MAEQTGIAWCDHTFNPWMGCTKVSAACDHCYAEAFVDHRMGLAEWGNHPRRRTSPANWRQPIKWDRAAAAAGVRRKVFCASLADVFDNQVPDEWRTDLWALVAECQSLDWLLLTKRPQNIAKMLPHLREDVLWGPGSWPWPNVWLGTTAENQEEWDRRLPPLGAVSAAVHFVSVEPMLEEIDCGNAFDYAEGSPYSPVKWVICGGESGMHARPLNIDWARSLQDQCRLGAGAAFFMKQLGGHVIQGGERRIKRDKKGGDMSEWPHDLRVREFPMTGKCG